MRFGYSIKLELFHFSFCSRFFKLSNDLLRFVGRHAFLNGLRRSVYKILRFFQSKSCNSSYDFDNAYLGSSRIRKDYIELRFFFSSFCRSAACARYDYRCGCGYSEFFFCRFY